jgi:hypothetical protein
MTGPGASPLALIILGIWCVVLVFMIFKGGQHQRKFKITIPAFFVAGSFFTVMNVPEIGVFLQFIGVLILMYMFFVHTKFKVKKI